MKWLIGAVALALAALAILAGVAGTNLLNGGSTPSRTPSTYTPTTVTVYPAPTYTRPAPAGIGVPVRDGTLEFTVHGIRRSPITQIPGNPMGQTQAVGEYVIVSLTVKNVGSTPTQYFTDSQSLVINGRQHSADILGAVYLNPESADYIQPGLAIDIETPFDVPVGSIPESIVLTDIANPSGVTVSLVGVPIS